MLESMPQAERFPDERIDALLLRPQEGDDKAASELLC